MRNTWILVGRQNGAKIFEVTEPYGLDLPDLDNIRLIKSFSDPEDCNQQVVDHLDEMSEEYAALILVADDPEMSHFRSCLKPGTQERLIGGIPLDLFDSDERDILEAVKPILDLQRHRPEYAA